MIHQKFQFAIPNEQLGNSLKTKQTTPHWKGN